MTTRSSLAMTPVRLFGAAALMLLAARASSAQGAKPAAKPAAKASAKPAPKSSAIASATLAKKPEPKDTVVPAVIMRESFTYDRAGRRDPFVSLLTTNELRPTISDLHLTGILFDRSVARNSVATLRDQAANKTYNVRTGTTLGRMRVTAIKPMSVVFTIDEFGTTRQDSLVLRDPTKARER